MMRKVLAAQKNQLMLTICHFAQVVDTSCSAFSCAAVPHSLVTINTLLVRNQDVQVLSGAAFCYQLVSAP
jgi:hypothetical protein